MTKNNQKQQIYIYEPSGGIYRISDTIVGAAKTLNVHRSTLADAINKGGLCGGYYIRKEKLSKKEFLKTIPKNKSEKTVYLYRTDGSFIDVFHSINECAKFIGCGRDTLRKVIETKDCIKWFVPRFEKIADIKIPHEKQETKAEDIVWSNSKVDPVKETKVRTTLLKEIANSYNDNELRAIAGGGRVLPGMNKIPTVNFQGERIRIGAMSDTHFGSTSYHASRLGKFFEECKKEKVDFITHCGDVVEGMSNRDGHVYELSHIGYTQQLDYAISQLGQWTDTDMYLIDGNHDRWFIKNSGALIVRDICDKLGSKFHYLGHDEGDINIGGKTTLKLWHGEDGNSYALSYRPQKIVEALSGGTKPGAIFLGHVHKSLYVLARNIHCYGIGSLQLQTAWMRSKRIEAHVGFWIIDLYVNKSGICKTTGTFYPFYA